jgi:uncharacterized membrane protein
MQRWKNSLFNITIALNCLLVFLLLFQDRLAVPAWLQVAGRMHPLVLHFPIVLLVIYAITVIVLPRQINSNEAYKNITGLLLLLTAFTAAATAVMGLFLSKEPGYDAEALQWHKWAGVSVSVFTLLWYAFSKQLQANKIISALISLTAFFLIIFTGHQGAGITHGQNFLLAPIMPEKKQLAVSPDEAVVFTNMVAPILKAKCEGCHNSKKAKGELVMETEELLLKGGKNGKLWDSTAPDLGLLLRRIHLPVEQKKHMPPQGKPQLTEDEIAIITQWIRKGSDFNLKLATLSPADTLRQLADKIFAQAAIAEYDFDEADAAVVEKLNTANRVVSKEAYGSPALTVSFYNSTIFNAAQLKELDAIKKQVVTLNLAKMPVTDADIKLISGFENLRRLNLSFTNITGAALQDLQKLRSLKSLSLSGTNITAAQLQQLKDLPQLKKVYAWHTAAAAADIKKLQEQLKNISFETGFNGDTTIMKLTPPVVLNEEGFVTGTIPLKLKHYIQGATIRYTTDGSEPDSIHAAVYKGNETISSNTFIKAKAFKAGWISSDIIEASFYKSTYRPDSVIYLQPADSSYKDEQGKILIDKEKGEVNFKLGNWVAFRKNRMECLLQFTTPVPVQSITLSCLVDVGSYIMPAQKIEIWGGDDSKKLRQLSILIPEQPTMLKPAYMKGFECKFNTAAVKYIKIIAVPVGKLPLWHPGKGDKAWIFTDEILVN